MKISEGQREEIKQKVRRYLVRYPKANANQIANALSHDYNFINELKNEIHKEAAERINKQTLTEEIGKLEEEIQEVAQECWDIISEQDIRNKDSKLIKSGASRYEKLNAIRTLLGAKKTLFDTKFDAGIFERKLGETVLKFDDILKILYENKTNENNTDKPADQKSP